jgi:antitoxin VapB
MYHLNNPGDGGCEGGCTALTPPIFPYLLRRHLAILSKMVYTADRYPRRSLVETAKLFKNGRSQAVRLPKEFRLDGAQVFIKKMGNAVVLIPYRDSWQPLLASLTQFSDDFMESRGQPEQQARESLFE